MGSMTFREFPSWLKGWTCCFLVIFLCLGLYMSVIGSTLPDLQLRTNSTGSEIAVIFTARGMGYLTGSLFDFFSIISL